MKTILRKDLRSTGLSKEQVQFIYDTIAIVENKYRADELIQYTSSDEVAMNLGGVIRDLSKAQWIAYFCNTALRDACKSGNPTDVASTSVLKNSTSTMLGNVDKALKMVQLIGIPFIELVEIKEEKSNRIVNYAGVLLGGLSSVNDKVLSCIQDLASLI